MARKNISQPNSRSGGGTLVGMFIGLVLGVCIAAGIVWYINRAHSPFVNKQRPEAPPIPLNGKAGEPAQPLPLVGKPGDPMPQKRFDFHDILTGKSDGLSDNGAAEKKTAANQIEKPESKPVEGKELKQPLLFLAGSFTAPQDADNQKMRLALLGIEASILQVMVQDKTFYRVLVGPYKQNEEANRVRSELAKNGIDVILIKKEQ
ncbi:MAG: cell division protein FtsN [Betaproteobacteria bacterium ADurb.Bin341]|nr:MAG: cell division protein FtsN [Betaproteobacteria bacterium ADurb.Bin341]